ncbi:MAG: response regulator transcription factor [Phycisphaerae bacterium]|nr:response regulator transcription factor [Phycisphaerae bacterium]
MTGTRGVICVVDDDDGVRRGLSQLLGHAGYTVAEFGSATAFLEAGLTTPPACVVVDLRLPGASGLDLLAAMRERGTRAPAIMLTGYGDVPTAVQAMKAGAYDFVEKPYVPENLLRTVEEAVRSGPAWRSGTARLTQRQQEIYDQLHLGASPEDVAKALNLSVKTVYAHRQAIMDKLGLTSHEFARSPRTTA